MGFSISASANAWINKWNFVLLHASTSVWNNVIYVFNYPLMFPMLRVGEKVSKVKVESVILTKIWKIMLNLEKIFMWLYESYGNIGTCKFVLFLSLIRFFSFCSCQTISTGETIGRGIFFRHASVWRNRQKHYFSHLAIQTFNIHVIIQEILPLLCTEANKTFEDVRNTYATINTANTAFKLVQYIINIFG